MAIPFFSDKQSWEAYHLAFDFSNLLDGEAISNAAVSASDFNSGDDATSTIIDSSKQQIDGSIVYFWVKSGTDGKTYKLTCKVTGAAGSQYETDGRMRVIDL